MGAYSLFNARAGDEARASHPQSCIALERTLNRRSRPRPISTARLNTLLCLHLRPINLVVYEGSYLVTQ
jgi:hypothetical protein